MVSNARAILLADAHKTAEMIKKQIEAVEKDAFDQGYEPLTMRYSSGEYALVPLLGALAQIQLAIAIHNQPVPKR